MTTDALGYRKKFAVLAPSTNTIVEPDFYRMSVPGVTAHFSRIHIRNQDLSSDANFEGLLDQIRAEIGSAIERVLTSRPGYMVMGMSAETFWEGVEGSRRFTAFIEQASGLSVSTGAAACEEALAIYKAKRIAVISPYQPIGGKNVRRFFEELGFEVTEVVCLRCPTAVAIAEVQEDTLRAQLRAVDDDRVDAIVQVGTNLSMLRLADEAERWLGKPVIAINAATWWHALRANGIQDRIEGCGSLLWNH
jgi:maleate isomerase